MASTEVARRAWTVIGLRDRPHVFALRNKPLPRPIGRSIFHYDDLVIRESRRPNGAEDLLEKIQPVVGQDYDGESWRPMQYTIQIVLATGCHIRFLIVEASISAVRKPSEWKINR